MTQRTCGTCQQAEPSESLHGFVLCALNMAAGGQHNLFSKKCVHLSPNKEACGNWCLRTSVLVFPKRAAEVEQPTDQEEVFVPVTPAPPQRDIFSKDFFL